jgi:Flp pilus assembly protein TadD
MKIGLAILAAGMLALPLQAQKPEQSKAEQSRVRQLEIQLARYREATDKLVATLSQANADLNVRVKALSKDRAEMSIRIAHLEVKLGRGPKPARLARGLLYRGDYRKAVESLASSVASMQMADSVDEAVTLSDGAMREVLAVRAVIFAHRWR